MRDGRQPLPAGSARARRMTPHLLLDIVVPAETAWDAEVAAKAWAYDETKIRLVRLTRVRPAVMSDGKPWPGHWAVEFAYSVVTTDQTELGL